MSSCRLHTEKVKPYIEDHHPDTYWTLIQWHDHFPGELVPMLDHCPSEELFPNIQSEISLTYLSLSLASYHQTAERNQHQPVPSAKCWSCRQQSKYCDVFLGLVWVGLFGFFCFFTNYFTPKCGRSDKF